MTVFRLTFAGSGADQVYRLDARGALTPESVADIPGCAEVLVVPASEGVPFQVEVPFSDPDKIRRVLPQLVGDRFARVSPEWHFSWIATPAQHATRVSGLAFPPAAIRRPVPGRDGWRLVIPDFMLVSASSAGWIPVNAPFSQGMVEFDEGCSPSRFHLSGRGLPEPCRESSTPVFDPVREGVAVFAACSAALESRDGRDLSGWFAGRQQRLSKTATVVGVGLVVCLIVLWHLFLAWDCSRLEERRRQLNLVLARSFERVFPGQRAVEPVLQARKLLEEREREAEKRVPEPIVPLLALLDEGLRVVETKARVEKFSASGGGWRLQGVIGSYRELSSLTAALPATSVMSQGQTRETSPIKPDGKTIGGLRFVLEGPWKR